MTETADGEVSVCHMVDEVDFVDVYRFNPKCLTGIVHGVHNVHPVHIPGHKERGSAGSGAPENRSLRLSAYIPSGLTVTMRHASASFFRTSSTLMEPGGPERSIGYTEAVPSSFLVISMSSRKTSPSSA